MQRSIGVCFFLTFLFSVTVAASAETLTNAEAHNQSLQNLMQLALKTKKPTCVRTACKTKVGWCICCGDVVDCRLATGGAKKAQ